MIAVIDYGAGNLRSVTNLLDSFDAKYRVVDSADGLIGSSHIVLPAVAHFGQICTAFERLCLGEALIDEIRIGTPYLGICLGMQVLFESSEEAPNQKGLGILSGSVRKLEAEVRIPHMGWNTLEGDAKSALCSQQAGQFAYFAHSFFCPVSNATVRSTTHGSTFSSVIEHENIFGVQFHPEKSGALGLSLLQKFVAL